MGNKPKQFDEATANETLPAMKTVRKVHPEELAIGDSVALSSVTYQYPSFMWCGVSPMVLPADEAVRIGFQPFEAEPLTVKAVCLPYVLCEAVDGVSAMYDLRLVRLVKLDPNFAKVARKALKCNSKSKKEPKKKKRKKSKSKKSK